MCGRRVPLYGYREPDQADSRVYLLVEVKGTLVPTSHNKGKVRCERAVNGSRVLNHRLVEEGLVTSPQPEAHTCN